MAVSGEIGPKADSLERLREAGLPVPEARHLGVDAYLDHAERAGVPEAVADAAGTALDSARVRDAIVRTPVSEEVASRLRRWHSELGGGMLAVRSSADAEDLPNASFAGQHGTYFVARADELADRVRDCWASLYSERAVRYRERDGMDHTGVAMAVIVQRFVPADCAGVAFTVDPLAGADQVWIEACPGIGEALVSGKVTPDRFVLGRPDLRVVEVAPGDKRVRVDGSPRGVEETAVAERAACELCIDEDAVREVAELALAAEAALGGPVDVEWAREGDRTWLLQARPVTTLPGPGGAEGSGGRSGPAPAGGSGATTAGLGPVPIWSNVNTGEILPDVATPMTWTIIHGHADDIFSGMFGALGVRIDARKLIGLVGGRVYFNLSLVRESFRHIPGFDVDTALGGMHSYVEIPPLEPGTGGRATFRSKARALVGLPAYVIRHSPGKAGRFADGMRRSTDAQLAAIRTRPDAAGTLALVRALNDDFSEFNEALAFMMVAMGGFGVLGKLCEAWLDDDSGALANRLVAAQGDVVSAEAGHAMWRLGELARDHATVRGPVLRGAGWEDVREQLAGAADRGDEPAHEFLDAWDAFMSEHGHHRRGELEFANPSWAESPDYVLSLVRGYAAHAEADPLASYADRARDAGAAADECIARLGGAVRRAIFRCVLAWGRQSARMRENIKSEAVRWLGAIRQALLLLGERMVEAGALERPDDIFFVEYGELDALAGDPVADLWRPLIASRLAEHERLERLSPPPVVVGTWDEASGPWEVPAGARTLTGITVSAGVARGRARVFLSADTEDAVLPGEILVAPFTDPGWTPYFVPAAGIVMDMGGLLSHGSIIAREYGIPAVVNVGPATRIITTGQLIEVDGDKGEVRILD